MMIPDSGLLFWAILYSCCILASVAYTTISRLCGKILPVVAEFYSQSYESFDLGTLTF